MGYSPRRGKESNTTEHTHTLICTGWGGPGKETLGGASLQHCNSQDPPRSVQFSCSVTADSLQPHGLQHARPPCPSPAPQNLLKLMSIESVMPSDHLILCRPLLLPPSILPSIRVSSPCSQHTPLQSTPSHFPRASFGDIPPKHRSLQTWLAGQCGPSSPLPPPRPRRRHRPRVPGTVGPGEVTHRRKKRAASAVSLCVRLS